MNKIKVKTGEENIYLLIMVCLVTGMVFFYRKGISGNDFWWHVKAGEWMVKNRTLPAVDVFSWFSKENGLIWISHEWLSEVFFYAIHKLFGDLGIFILSLSLALLMIMMITNYNKKKIKTNLILSMFYLIPSIFLFPLFFYGRPHLLTFFLLFLTLYCLYKFKFDENSKSIMFIPVISILWSNLHGGSSNLPYILCFIFALSGITEFSAGKIIGEKLSRKQLVTYSVVGILSIAFLALNPHGLSIITYPFINMRDSFMQKIISEWSSPDAKQIYQLVNLFLPLFIVGLTLIATDKKIKFIDLLIFLFFTYLLFRSVRFGILFYISSSFYVFEYVIPRGINDMRSSKFQLLHYLTITLILSVNLYSVYSIIETTRNQKLITVALEQEFIEVVKKDAPKRLFNDYNYGETLIYNDIETFVDARADIFTSHNLKDAVSLVNLTDADNIDNGDVFDPESVINKYKFDALLLPISRSLTVYLKSRPEEYKILLQTSNSIYFKKIHE